MKVYKSDIRFTSNNNYECGRLRKDVKNATDEIGFHSSTPVNS